MSEMSKTEMLKFSLKEYYFFI